MAGLRVGVVGCGPIGALHADAVRSCPAARLVSLCDVDLGPARALAGRLGSEIACRGRFEEMLAEDRVDVVTVATPDHLHVDVVLAAVAAGCHVFCEKPLAANAADARRMVEAAARRGVALGVDYNRRFGFGYRTARRLVDEGKIGAVQLLLIHVLDRTPPPEVVTFPEVILTTLLTHHLDLARWFGGDVARLRTRFGEIDLSGPPLRRDVSLVLEFAGGALGKIVAGYRDDQARTVEQAHLVGERGSLHVEDVTGAATSWAADLRHRQTYEPETADADSAFPATITLHVHRFLECVAAGSPPPVPGLEGLRSLELVKAALRSHSAAGFVPVHA
jgi:myo-inositol 2-dehydrogenase/D-chiro-inositol 1-dehydrogenase